MQEYFRLGEFHIFKAPVFVHWSALASMGLILVVYWKDPIIAVIALLSFLSVILIHEIGHAAVQGERIKIGSLLRDRTKISDYLR